jgi:hypothetical protein
MLILIASTQASGDTTPTWVNVLIFAFILPLMAISVFFIIRYQFRLFRNIENAMMRIADAIEAIAAQR